MFYLNDDESLKYLLYERNGILFGVDYVYNNVNLRIWNDGTIGKYVKNKHNELRIKPIFKNNDGFVKINGRFVKSKRLVFFAFNPHLSIYDKSIHIHKHNKKIQFDTYHNLYSKYFYHILSKT